MQMGRMSAASRSDHMQPWIPSFLVSRKMLSTFLSRERLKGSHNKLAMMLSRKAAYQLSEMLLFLLYLHPC